MTEIHLATVVAAALGSGSVVAWLLAKAGRLTYWVRWYRNPAVPIWLRHVAFAWMPMGATLLLVAAGLWALQRSPSSTVGFVTIILGMLSGAATGFVILRPPKWAKPKWLADEEADSISESKNGVLLVRVLIINFLLAALSILVLRVFGL